MLSRQEITKTIQRLYRRREALNITAVKRSHPELIQSVYAMQPFWGWKQALTDGGINYAKIRIELEEYLTCEICRKLCQNLSSHLIHKHGVEWDEYLMDYPDSEGCCETRRAELLAKENLVLRHWEPLWSREYILDRAAEYSRCGYPMHHSKFRSVELALVQAARRYMGGWNEVLVAVGLDPRKLRQAAWRRVRKHPDKESVIQDIKQRLKKGLRVNSALVQNDQGALLQRGTEYFGSWDNALKAAGVDPAAVRQVWPKYATSQDVICEIQARHKRKLGINSVAVTQDKHRDTALGRSARKYFGSWDNALKAAGFNPLDIRLTTSRHLRFPNNKSLLQAIQKRHQEGRFLNSDSLQRGSVPDCPLLRWASQSFGSWDKALKAAGLDPLKIRRQAVLRHSRYPDQEAAVKAIKQRNRSGRRMNHTALERGPNQDVPLLRRAKEFFGSWDKALKAAGLDQLKIRREAVLRGRRARDAKLGIK